MTEPPANPDLSVLVCTRDRCAKLARLLDALERLELPPHVTWELVVVDNGSSDGTPALLERAAARLPLRTVVVPERGVSRARNAALDAARGRVLAFTDDDCIPDPRWLATIHEEFARDPALAILGGRVELFDARDFPITIRSGRERRVCASAREVTDLVVGCNLAFRRSAASAVGRFDETLGAGTPAAAAEDIDFAYRIARRGMKLVYVPEALVLHDHGRRTDAEVSRLRGVYTRGRGAMFAKHLLRLDRVMLRRVADDARLQARMAMDDLRARRFPRRAVRHYALVAAGAAGWLRTRIARAVSARRADRRDGAPSGS